ncbi:MAG: DUF2235 domain-containing protein [Opitutaceae bacterium]
MDSYALIAAAMKGDAMAKSALQATNTSPGATQATKNIIVLSDGTGNSSASIWRTNVWRVFQSLDLTDSSQVALYADGVGTSSFKPLAVVGGAFGYGLKRNVLDLYTFLCRNYSADADPQIFGFGFSRGAYTVRVITGLIANQGLVSYESEAQLRRHAKAAYRAYRSERFHTLLRVEYPFRLVRDGILALWDRVAERILGRTPYSEVKRIQPLPIRFLGLWDTVAAYGMPFEELTTMISQWIWPLELPSRELAEKVERACHAISIDDERTTFHPLILNEKDVKPRPEQPNSAGKVGRWVEHERISQIWFSGVHSNVGGGYPDDSLSQVPLFWMLGEAKCCGLRIKENPPWGPGATSPFDPVHEPDAFKQARSARDKDGRQYDSRQGLAGYYRYGPRKIHDLCNVSRSWINDYEVEVKVPKIHCSVFERIKNGAHGYAPFGLPAQYAVVTADGEILDPSANPYESPEQAVERGKIQEHVWDLVWHRRVNYFLALGVSLWFALFPFFADDNPDMGTGTWAAFLSPVIRLLGSFLPGFLTQSWVGPYAAYPQWFAVLAIGVIVLVLRGVSLGSRINDKMRALWRVPSQGSAPSSWEYWLRNRPWYPKLIGATKRHVVPFLLLLLLLYFGFVGISRALFTTGSSLGLICHGTQNDTLRSPPASATSPFTSSSLCWASGIRLEKGIPYRIVVERTQPSWFDGDISTTPLGFEQMTGRMYGAFLLKRDLGKPWFGLTARTGRCGLDEQPLDLKPRIGLDHSAQVTPRASGELFLFVNDAVIGFPWLARIFYRNNVGDAQIKVEPLARCAAPPSRCPG